MDKNKNSAALADTAGGLLDDNGAARFLNVKPRTVQEWRRKRGLPHIRITQKLVRFRRDDLEKWVSRHHVAIVN
jgi:excisionase family DNA binding protein